MISISNNSMKQTLHKYLLHYKAIFKKRSFDIFYWLIMNILCMEEVRSIQFLYDYFIKKYTDKVLNSIYYFLSYAKFPIEALTSGKVRYLSLPAGYRLYSSDQNKLEMTAEMIENIMPQLKTFQVILLCNSWYSKGQIIKTIKKHDNLEIIGAVRHDTAIYDLAPAPTGKPGRPRKKGDRLNIREFSYTKIGEYYVSEQKVMTNLFERAIYLAVTTTDIETFASVRVYISSINPEEIDIFKSHESSDLTCDNEQPQSKILSTYRMRWNIEVIFYQHKFFWSFGNYILRNKDAIERYVNLLAVAYTFVCLLPFIDQKYDNYQFQSPQVIKRAVGEHITRELIFDSFVSSFESTEIYSIMKKAVLNFLDKDQAA